MIRSHFILYVRDQTRSADFYSAVLAMQPTLDVPGMTEFTLAENVVLGLMPESGVARLFGSALPDPASGQGVARAELYLLVREPQLYHRRALAAGATQLSTLQLRDWGDTAAYSLDPDGHVLAFASPHAD